MKLYDIITISNNKDYVITKSLIYNNKEYLLLVAVDADENLLKEKLILEKINNNGDYYLSTIKSNNLKQIISEKFAKSLLEELK